MKAIKNCRIVLRDKIKEDGVLLYGEKTEIIISAAELDNYDLTEVIDAGGNMVTPGLIDIHTHGYLDRDISNCGAEDIKKIACAITENGVTSFLPTTMTVPLPQIEASFDACREKAEESRAWEGAEILGVNCEGPFISVSKKGAQKEEDIKKPDAGFIIKHSDIVKIVTIAPEEDTDFENIKKIKENSGVTVSIGHTAATYKTAKASFDAGVSHATHLFNAMTPLSHREPGVVGAALTDGRVACELIADTYHVDKALFEMVYKLKGEKLILITDTAPCAGMPEGEYMFGGQKIYSDGTRVVLADGTLAGSVLKLNVALRNFKENTSLSVPEIVSLATFNPAKEIGAESKGEISPGKDADYVIFDDNFNVIKTIKKGKVVYEK